VANRPTPFPSLAEVATHLERSGWTLRDRDERSTEWARSDLRVVLPISEDVVDYEAVVSAAVRTIAYDQQRPARDVLEDIALGGADIVALRFTPNAPQGEAPLRLAQAVVNAAKNLIVGAASALDLDSLVLPSRRPQRAEAFSGQARVGVEPGSFIFRLALPLSQSWSDGEVAGPPGQDPLVPSVDASYGRAVTRRLRTALIAAQGMATEVYAGRTGIPIFGRQPTVQVNATELDAFGGLGGPDREPYAIRFSPSPLVKTWSGDPEAIEVSSHDQAIFADAAEFLRSSQPREGVTLQGLVVRLRRDRALGPGEIVVQSETDDSGRQRRVRLELTEDDYAWAVMAHRSGLQIRVRGNLVTRGKAQQLIHVSDFGVIGGLPDDF
jgi:hypothetical protein